jgi:hypothetical protein
MPCDGSVSATDVLLPNWLSKWNALLVHCTLLTYILSVITESCVAQLPVDAQVSGCEHREDAIIAASKIYT